MNPDDINKNIQKFNESLASFNKKEGTNLSGLGTIPQTVTSKELSAPAIDVPTQAPSTSVKGEIANLESQTDSFTKNLQEQATQSQKQEQTSFEDLMSQFASSPTEAGLEATKYAQKGGVDEINKELVDINNQIRSEQQALRRRIEAIQDNKTGLFGGAVQDEVNRVERESLHKQADLAVIQQSVQGRYDSAKTIADRAIKAEMDFQQKKLDLLELSYNRNKSLFDKSEQRLFETQQADRQRKLDQEEKAMKEISDLSIQALQDGAPTSVVSAMRAAKTPEEAIRLGGRYVGALDRQVKGLSIRKSLIDLAKNGDRSAIAQLGYDPNKSPADIVSSENAADKVQKDISRVSGLLKNTFGLGLSAGTLRGRIPTIAGATLSGLIGGAAAGSVVPGVGTAVGALGGGIGAGLGAFGATTPAKQKFLNDADYIIGNMTFEKFRELADLGVKLTPVSEKELELIAGSANELSKAAVRDEKGKLIGIDLPEDEVVRLLTDIQTKYQRVQNELNMKDAFSTDELLELNNL